MSGKQSVIVYNEVTTIDEILHRMGRGRGWNLLREGESLIWADTGQFDNKEVVFSPMKFQMLPGWVNDRFDLLLEVRDDHDNVKHKQILLTEKLAKVLMTRWRQNSGVRPLNGILTAPSIRPDGTLLDTPGYDESTGVWLLRNEGLAIPAEPNDLDIEAAKSLLLSAISEFPWVDDDGKSTFIGMWMIPGLRLLAPPPWPALVLDAKQRGSGKTLLAELIGLTYGKYQLHPPIPKSAHAEEELRKKIMSSLLDDSQVVIFDNQVGAIKMPVLTSLLTMTEWSDRILRYSLVKSVKNNKCWIITGNNVALGDDMVRRSVWASIDPRIVDPWMREFKKDLYSWVPANRADIIRAFCILARAWVQNGSKLKKTRGDVFGHSLGVVAGILENAGIPGEPFKMRPIDEGGSEDDREIIDTIDVLGRYFGGKEFGADEVIAKVTEHAKVVNSLGWALPESTRKMAMEVAETGHAESSPLRRSVAAWLRHTEGKYFTNGVLERVVDSGQQRALYKVVGAASGGDKVPPIPDDLSDFPDF